MKTREEMTAAVAAALARSAPIIRRLGQSAPDDLVIVRDRLRTIQVRQQLGISKGFHVQSLRRVLARHDAAVQELHDRERARESAPPLYVSLLGE